jgi:hypothetical protein
VIILLAVIGIASIVNNGSGYEDDDYPGYPYYTEEEAANGLYSDDYVTVDFSVMGEDVGENGVFRLESTGEEFPIYGNGMNFEYMVAKTAEVDAATWASFDKSLGESESEESIFAYMSATYGQVVSLITKEYGMLGSETNADVKDVKFFPLDTDSGGVSAYMVGRLTDSATGDFNGCIGLALSESRHGYVCIIMQQSPGWNVGMEEDETIDRFSGLMEYGIWFADYGVDESDDIDDIDA